MPDLQYLWNSFDVNKLLNNIIDSQRSLIRTEQILIGITMGHDDAHENLVVTNFHLGSNNFQGLDEFMMN